MFNVSILVDLVTKISAFDIFVAAFVWHDILPKTSYIYNNTLVVF